MENKIVEASIKINNYILWQISKSIIVEKLHIPSSNKEIAILLEEIMLGNQQSNKTIFDWKTFT